MEFQNKQTKIEKMTVDKVYQIVSSKLTAAMEAQCDSIVDVKSCLVLADDVAAFEAALPSSDFQINCDKDDVTTTGGYQASGLPIPTKFFK